MCGCARASLLKHWSTGMPLMYWLVDWGMSTAIPKETRVSNGPGTTAAGISARMSERERLSDPPMRSDIPNPEADSLTARKSEQGEAGVRKATRPRTAMYGQGARAVRVSVGIRSRGIGVVSVGEPTASHLGRGGFHLHLSSQ